jgi:hypothetical protein
MTPSEKDLTEFWSQFNSTKKRIRNASIEAKMHQIEVMSEDTIGTESIRDTSFSDRVSACIKEWEKGNKVVLRY